MPDPPSPSWIIEPLGPQHDRGAFDCGQEPLNVFLRQYAGQNQRTGVSQTHVATRTGQTHVQGYYSMAAGSIELLYIPEAERRNLPRYPIPVMHIGRLAVDRRAQGQRLGKELLFHAFGEVLRATGSFGIHSVEVRAKDDDARNFYLRYGFTELTDDRLHLYLPVRAIRKLGLA